MGLWDMMFRMGADTKPLRQDMERVGAHMDDAAKKIGKKFGLTWSNAIAGVTFAAVGALGAAFHGAMTDALEKIKGSNALKVTMDDFTALKALSEETGVSVERLAKSLNSGDINGKSLRKQMEEAKLGIIGPSDASAGQLKSMSSATSAGWQSFKNLTGSVAGGLFQGFSNMVGFGVGSVKGVGALLKGKGVGGFQEALSDQLAQSMTTGDTALTRSKLMAGEAHIAEALLKRREEEANKKPDKFKTTFEKYESGVSADALAKTGILYSRFGMNSRQQWETDMLSITKRIEQNTAATKPTELTSITPN
jgi:hypothetical protein